MASPREGQRAIDIDLYPGHLLQQFQQLQLFNECVGSLHRADRMGGGGANTDLEQIENRDHEWVTG